MVGLLWVGLTAFLSLSWLYFSLLDILLLFIFQVQPVYGIMPRRRNSAYSRAQKIYIHTNKRDPIPNIQKSHSQVKSKITPSKVTPAIPLSKPVPRQSTTLIPSAGKCVGIEQLLLLFIFITVVDSVYLFVYYVPQIHLILKVRPLFYHLIFTNSTVKIIIVVLVKF